MSLLLSRLRNTFGAEVERAHLLLDVIQNLETDGDFYARRTLQFRLRANDELFKALKESTSA